MLSKVLMILASLVLVAALWFGYTYVAFYMLRGPSEDIRIESRGVALAATLLTPGTEGPYPAVVILHGAGPGTRGDAGYRALARTILDAGLAVLVYDKRGSGDSGGEFRSDGYDDFIADGRAAVQALAVRPNIDATRIGLVGASESGWFTPIIAAEEQVAFVINKAGPPLSWIDTVLWEVRSDLLAEGITPAEAEREAALLGGAWRLMARLTTDPSQAEVTRAELAEAIRAIRESGPDAAADHAKLLAAYDSGEIADYAKRQIIYDPSPQIAALDIPMLYIFAENDINVPTAASVAFLETLRRDKARDITYLVLPDVGHDFYSWKGLFTGGYPPAYRDAIQDWLRQKI